MPGDPLSFWLVFFQLAAGVVLAFRRAEPRLPTRLLAAMLLLNAGVSAIWFQSFWPPWDPGRRIAAALDAPTEALALAFLASLSSAPWARRATVAFAALAVAMGAVAPFMYPDPSTPLSRGFEAFRQALYFVGLALVAFRLSGGQATWERWAALAFLPRAFYWSTTGSFVVADVVAGVARPADQLVLLTVPFLAVVSAAAYVRLLRRPRPPQMLAVVLVPLTGVAIGIAEFGVRQLQPVDPVLVPVLSLLTLGLHRPLFLLVGLAPGMLGTVALRATACAVVGSAALAGLEAFFPGASGAAILAGFVSGAMTLAVLEVLWPRLETWEGAEAPPPRRFALHVGGGGLAVVRQPAAPASPPGPSPAASAPALPPAAEPPAPAPSAPPRPAAPARASDRPQWQDLVLSLRGSSLSQGAPARGEPHLTQKALVERTGIGAPRISTIVRELNDGAAARLDAHVSGWRDAVPRPVEVALVQQFRGSIPGVPGVWVYYRLTPLGERLAAALDPRPAGVRAEAASDGDLGPSPSAA